MKPLAAIDIGSNSLRLIIGRVINGQVEVLLSDIITTRLGVTVPGAALNRLGVEDTLAALSHFKEGIDAHGAKVVAVAATSAVREAADGEEFCREIREKFGWPAMILSGHEEAFYSFQGAASAIGGVRLLLDVGGGSSEAVWFDESGGFHTLSVPMGAVRLWHNPLSRPELQECLQPLAAAASPSVQEAVTVGGTISAVALVCQNMTSYSREKISGYRLTKERIQQLYDELAPLSPEERRQLYPILGKRAEIIATGLAIYLSLLEILALDAVIASDSGLPDGLIVTGGPAARC